MTDPAKHHHQLKAVYVYQEDKIAVQSVLVLVRCKFENGNTKRYVETIRALYSTLRADVEW
jgi:hypothetical protein